MSTSARPASHTSSQQWQSFEIKMRYRRAERCVLRATAALEAGMEEEARAYLNEARALNPDTPALDSLRAAVRQRQAVAAAAARRAKRRRLAAVAVMIAALGAGAIWFVVTWLANPDTGVPIGTPDVQVGRVAGPELPSGGGGSGGGPDPGGHLGRPDPQVGQGGGPDLPVRRDAPGVAATAGVADAARGPIAVSLDPAKREPMPPPALREVEPASPIPQPPIRPTTNDALPRSILPSVAFDRLVSGLPVANPPAPALPAADPPARDPAAALPAPGPSAPVRPAPAEAVATPPPENALEAAEPRVRAALARFESAYSNLDAAAAQAVWPGVDGRSLARAFDSLESQHVSLGRCSISLTGAAARADCTGTTTWTPKVGGGTRTEPRRWQFELAAADGVWHIVTAQVR